MDYQEGPPRQTIAANLCVPSSMSAVFYDRRFTGCAGKTSGGWRRRGTLARMQLLRPPGSASAGRAAIHVLWRWGGILKWPCRRKGMTIHDSQVVWRTFSFTASRPSISFFVWRKACSRFIPAHLLRRTGIHKFAQLLIELLFDTHVVEQAAHSTRQISKKGMAAFPRKRFPESCLWPRLAAPTPVFPSRAFVGPTL
jgi:hypothetical protein